MTRLPTSSEITCEGRLSLSMKYDWTNRTGYLYMEEGHCADCTGCIDLFRKIDPEVATIFTYSGDNEDTVYWAEAHLETGRLWWASHPRAYHQLGGRDLRDFSNEIGDLSEIGDSHPVLGKIWGWPDYPNPFWKETNWKNAESPSKAITKPRRRSVDLKLRFKVMKGDNFTCRLCKRSGVPLEVDHIKPVSKGGSSSLDNLQTLCFECNRGKSDEDLSERKTNLDLLSHRKLLEMADKYYFLVGDDFGWQCFEDIENLIEPKWFSVMICPTINGMFSLAMLDKKGIDNKRLSKLLTDVAGVQVIIPPTIRFISITAEQNYFYLQSLLDLLNISEQVEMKDCMALFPV